MIHCKPADEKSAEPEHQSHGYPNDCASGWIHRLIGVRGDIGARLQTLRVANLLSVVRSGRKLHEPEDALVKAGNRSKKGYWSSTGVTEIPRMVSPQRKAGVFFIVNSGQTTLQPSGTAP